MGTMKIEVEIPLFQYERFWAHAAAIDEPVDLTISVFAHMGYLLWESDPELGKKAFSLLVCDYEKHDFLIDD